MATPALSMGPPRLTPPGGETMGVRHPCAVPDCSGGAADLGLLEQERMVE